MRAWLALGGLSLLALSDEAWFSFTLPLALHLALTLLGVGLVALGYRDRWAAIGLFLLGWGHQVSAPGLGEWAVAFLVDFAVYGGFLLHAATPRAPFGSVEAIGRPDPGGGWRMPRWIPNVAWGTQVALLVTLALLHDAWLVAIGAVALGALLLLGRPRLGGWLLAVALHLALWLLVEPNLRLVTLLMWMAAFTFEPAWIRSKPAARHERLFYDGACGLCHRAVRVLVAEDVSGARFRYAPLAGPTFQSEVPAELHGRLPDSILLVTADGELLDKSRAALHAMARLGGLWRLLAWLGEAVPLALRDLAYDAIARRRHRWFSSPDEACPLLPQHLRERFDA